MFSSTFAARLGLVLAAPFLVRSVMGAAPCTRTYTIVKGDICDHISKIKHVSTFQLAAVNADYINPGCSNLEPGDELCLGTEGEDCEDTYVIRDGDSCASIMQAHSINSTILMGNNPNLDDDCSNIYPGEVLCVATKIIAPPIPEGFFVENGNTDYVPVNPGDEGYDDDLPFCDEVNHPPTTGPDLSGEDDDDLPYCDEVNNPAPVPDLGDEDDEDDDLPYCDEVEQ